MPKDPGKTSLPDVNLGNSGQVFTIEEVQDLLKRGLAADGREGGLIIGSPKKHEDYIHLLVNYGNHYKLMGQADWYDYIWNIAASYVGRKLFERINNPEEHSEVYFEPYVPNSHVQLIRAEKFILIEGRGTQLIINKFSAKRKLEIINGLNKDYKAEYDKEEYDQSSSFRIIEIQTGNILDNVPLTWKDQHL